MSVEKKAGSSGGRTPVGGGEWFGVDLGSQEGLGGEEPGLPDVRL